MKTEAKAKRGCLWIAAGVGMLSVFVVVAVLLRSGPDLAIGDTARVVDGPGYWPCGSSRAALDEMEKWASRGDQTALRSAMGRTRSIGLTEGLRVKILDTGVAQNKVRVVANRDGKGYERDADGVFPADPRIGAECWVTAEALTRWP